ncbi:MAG: hypothetical protein L6Q35_08430 [Phycisphaerales bacterium]|nr:hypothetical protein [Phycisphaerales bacterium]
MTSSRTELPPVNGSPHSLESATRWSGSGTQTACSTADMSFDMLWSSGRSPRRRARTYPRKRRSPNTRYSGSTTGGKITSASDQAVIPCGVRPLMMTSTAAMMPRIQIAAMAIT